MTDNDCKNPICNECHNLLKLKIEAIRDQIYHLTIHKNRQIDENRKISKRVDELIENINGYAFRLEKRIDELEEDIGKAFSNIIEQFITNLPEEHHSPHKCPVCDGDGRVLTAYAKIDSDLALKIRLDAECKIPLNEICSACEGKGIVWG